jgi:hypothetical protein
MYEVMADDEKGISEKSFINTLKLIYFGDSNAEIQFTFKMYLLIPSIRILNCVTIVMILTRMVFSHLKKLNESWCTFLLT